MNPILIDIHTSARLHTHLDTNVVYRYDGVLQRGQAGLVLRLSHHDSSGHIDEVNANGLGHKGEGARRSQVAFNYLRKTKQTHKQIGEHLQDDTLPTKTRDNFHSSLKLSVNLHQI